MARTLTAPLILLICLAFGLAACATRPPQPGDGEALVAESAATVRGFLADPDFEVMPLYLERARAVVIFPDLVRGGFVFGAEGGEGVMIARRPDGSWGYPIFVAMATGSVGLQIGGQVSEVVLAIMTEDGVNAMLDRQVTLGADVNVAAVTAGVGIEARTGLDFNADMYAFARNRGLFVGGALEGAFVTPAEGTNRLYYGNSANARAILNGDFVNSQADILRNALPPFRAASN
jgi:lipid-binding SYLF domain-containing protein